MNIPLYSIGEIGDLKKWLKKQKYWVFCSNNEDKWDITDMNNPEIYKRVRVVDNCLEFTRLAKDPIYKGLRPRIEIRPMDFLLRKNVEYKINYKFKIVKSKGFRGMIFQLIDHFEYTNEPMPIFQIEIRNGKLHCRNSKLPSVDAEIFPFENVVENKWINLSFVVKLKGDNSGYILCYKDSKVIYNRRNDITGSKSGKVQVSIGIYAEPKYELITQVQTLDIIERHPLNF